MYDLYTEEEMILCDELAIDIESGEFFHEFATVARDSNLNMSVAVNPDRNRNLKNIEYFKVYNHVNPQRATKIARIKFRHPEYIIHNNNRRLKNWTLTSADKASLLELLNSESKKDIIPQITVWQSLIISFNYEMGLDNVDTLKNKSKKLVYPDFLPIDLPIPDYRQLL